MFKVVASGQTEMNALEVIDLALNAHLNVISISICTTERLLADIKIKGLYIYWYRLADIPFFAHKNLLNYLFGEGTGRWQKWLQAKQVR